MSILNKLNERQKKAAETIEGALLILAGAGSGKTRTVTFRIAHMIKELGISPYSILAVTFTNKAAKEMMERVEQLIGDDAKKATISTFHSFGVRLLRIYGNRIGYGSNFTIYDTDDQKRIIRGIMKNLVIKDKNLTEGVIASTISKLKEDGITPEDYDKDYKFQPNANIISEIYKRYNQTLKQNNGMDFSDILSNTLKLLEDKEVLEKIQNKYRYIMVDEYQDTNNIQYQIINKIAKASGNICVVGDENQSIYGFRGANIQNILNFEKDYPGALVVKLEENYRSTAHILDAANAVIKNNKSSRDKNLWTQKKTGEKITLVEVSDGRAEVDYVVKEIVALKSKGKLYKDFTVLYRTNAQSRLFEEGFLKYNIPYKIFGGMQFYQRAEIKDVLAYLSIINNSRDSISLNRIINVPKRKIGEKTLEKINEYAKENGITLFQALKKIEEIEGLTAAVRVTLQNFYSIIEELIDLSKELSVGELFDKVLGSVGYKEYLKSSYEDAESRIENIDELRNSIGEMEKIEGHLSLGEYLETVSLVSATDDLEENKDYVKLMTIHNSKGLEFPIVFLVGVEEEVFPGKKIILNPEELEEERRLCYVAITRAEEKLYLIHAGSRFVYGNLEYRNRSRFIGEIPSDLMEDKNGLPKEFPKSRFNISEKIVGKNVISSENIKSNGKDYPYQIGEMVTHKKFGLGKVVSVNDKKIEVQFIDGKKEIAMALADKFLVKE
jgi:DNA helicase-2/ATP-dependent DNA helicase PcrA